MINDVMGMISKVIEMVSTAMGMISAVTMLISGAGLSKTEDWSYELQI